MNAVTKDFYVDDFVKSVRTVNEASSLANEVLCDFYRKLRRMPG